MGSILGCLLRQIMQNWDPWSYRSSFHEKTISSLCPKQSIDLMQRNFSCIDRLLHVEKIYSHESQRFWRRFPDHIGDGIRKTWLNHSVPNRARNFVHAISLPHVVFFRREKLLPREVHPWNMASSALGRAVLDVDVAPSGEKLSFP